MKNVKLFGLSAVLVSSMSFSVNPIEVSNGGSNLIKENPTTIDRYEIINEYKENFSNLPQILFGSFCKTYSKNIFAEDLENLKETILKFKENTQNATMISFSNAVSDFKGYVEDFEKSVLRKTYISDLQTLSIADFERIHAEKTFLTFEKEVKNFQQAVIIKEFNQAFPNANFDDFKKNYLENVCLKSVNLKNIHLTNSNLNGTWGTQSNHTSSYNISQRQNASSKFYSISNVKNKVSKFRKDHPLIVGSVIGTGKVMMGLGKAIMIVGGIIIVADVIEKTIEIFAEDLVNSVSNSVKDIVVTGLKEIQAIDSDAVAEILKSVDTKDVIDSFKGVATELLKEIELSSTN